MEHGELEEKHKKISGEILDLQGILVSTKILDGLGRSHNRGRKRYWVLNLIFLNLIVLGPWLLIGYTWHEFERARYLWISVPLTHEFLIAGFILAHVETEKTLHDIPAYIINKLIVTREMSGFGSWLGKSLAIPSMIPFVSFIGILWVSLGIAGESIIHQEFVGWGLSVTLILEGLLAGIALYSVYWITRIAYQLRKYRYELNWFSPVSSQVLHDITVLIKKRAYAFSLYFAVFMLTSSSSLVDRNSRLVFVLPAFIIIWTIMITQYLITRSTTAGIVDREKRRTLNRLTEKINQIDETCDLSDKETAERLLRLGEIQRQVLASKTSSYDLNSISTLLGQLMLPILGLLLGNLDKVSGLFP
jgi:hypothetical protein